jgi:hypothetical protein
MALNLKFLRKWLLINSIIIFIVAIILFILCIIQFSTSGDGDDRRQAVGTLISGIISLSCALLGFFLAKKEACFCCLLTFYFLATGVLCGLCLAQGAGLVSAANVLDRDSVCINDSCVYFDVDKNQIYTFDKGFIRVVRAVGAINIIFGIYYFQAFILSILIIAHPEKREISKAST